MDDKKEACTYRISRLCKLVGNFLHDALDLVAIALLKPYQRVDFVMEMLRQERRKAVNQLLELLSVVLLCAGCNTLGPVDSLCHLRLKSMVLLHVPMHVARLACFFCQRLVPGEDGGFFARMVVVNGICPCAYVQHEVCDIFWILEKGSLEVDGV